MSVTMCDVFDITDLKPEALYALIKTVALLSDFERCDRVHDGPTSFTQSICTTAVKRSCPDAVNCAPT
jgi:hypothetical protein